MTAVFSHSFVRRKKLKAAQLDLNLPLHQLKADCSTRWGSTNAMMVRVLEQQQAIRRVLAEDSKISNMLAGWWQTEQTLQATTSALNHYVKMTDGLSGEKHVTISTVLPLLFYINKLANRHEGEGEVEGHDEENGDGEAESETSLKGSIHTKVADYVWPRYGKDEVLNFITQASLLDPRYKQFVQTEHSASFLACRLRLIEEALCVGKYKNLDPDEPMPEPSADVKNQCQPPDPKSQSPSLADILQNVMSTSAHGRTVSELTPRQLITKEFDLYMETPAVATKLADGSFSDPLAWWKQHESIYPHMAVLAKKHLCVPATSVSSERMFSKSGHILNPKRNKTSPRMTNMLTFLSSNSDLCKM